MRARELIDELEYICEEIGDLEVAVNGRANRSRMVETIDIETSNRDKGRHVSTCDDVGLGEMFVLIR